MRGTEEKRRVVIRNKKARHDYEILEQFEAGIALRGAEVKSLREGKASFADPYARVEGGEVWLYNLHITPYAASTIDPPDPIRRRKLLLQRRQVVKLASKTAERGLTLVPLDLYFTPRGLAKVTLALARGKRVHDRRETLKREVARREMDRAVRQASRQR
ncbi:MAG: SsrA-binding protein SmpB [Gemmatimonadota bacterium]|nr:MAG: SsrA-binding protein SmpB [Gemmatimonadota bacterium]